MAAPVLQFKRGLLTNLPGLRAGEPGFTTDSYDLYVGLTSETSTNKFFGSHRYWTKETTSTGSGVNLVEGTSNGSDYITIKSPDSLAGIVTYTLPGTQGTASSVLTNDGSGNLTWAGGNANPVFTGIATFTDTTDNTLGDSDTGSVQIDGGLGIDKNVTVGANLNVQGYSEFVGVSTFGSNLDINASADISTNLTVGQNLSVTGVSTFTGLVDANGGADITGQVTLNNNLSVTGVSTFAGLVDANGGLDVLGHSELDNVNVSGIITAASVVFGSGTAITSVDTDLSTVSGSNDTLASAKAIKDYVDSQVTAADLDFAGDTGTGAVDLDSQTFTIAGTASEIVTSASGQTITIGLPDNVIVGAALTVTGALDVNGGGTIDNVRIGVAGDNEIDTSSGNLTIDSAGGTVTIDDELIVSGDVRINGNDIRASDGNVNITLTDGTLTTFAGDIEVNGNNIKASDGNTNITMTSNTLTEVKGDLQVTGDEIKGSGGATALTLSGTNVIVAGDLTVGGNDIIASDGTTALTLTAVTGAVTTANDLTVTGNLYVSGNTTQVNTAALTVEDRTIDLGIVNGAAPASATTWDLGVLFNYYTGGAAKKSAVVWEHSDARFKFASIIDADSNGTDANTPQLAVNTFAPIEIGALWVNDCAGQSQVISCTGSTRYLENITIDAGTF